MPIAAAVAAGRWRTLRNAERASWRSESNGMRGLFTRCDSAGNSFQHRPSGVRGRPNPPGYHPRATVVTHRLLVSALVLAGILAWSGRAVGQQDTTPIFVCG